MTAFPSDVSSPETHPEVEDEGVEAYVWFATLSSKLLPQKSLLASMFTVHHTGQHSYLLQ